MATSAAHAFERCEPFTVVVDRTEVKAEFVDHGDQGPSVGDRRIVYMPLHNEAGDVIGHLDGEFTAMHPDADGSIKIASVSLMQFPTGVLIFKLTPQRAVEDFSDAGAIPPPSEAARIIVGGSGVFAGATGTIEVERRDDTIVHTIKVTCN
jgi:hypothetical protein